MMPAASIAPIVRLYQTGQYPLAEAECRRLLSTNPRNAEASHLLGVILAQSGRMAEAVPWLETSVGLRPSNHEARLALGQALGMCGKAIEAQRCFEKILRAQPHHLQALYNLGLSLSHQRQHEAANKAFARILAREPGHVMAWMGQGGEWAMLGRFDRALECFAKANALAPGKPEILEQLAKALLAARRLDEAEQVARQALTIDLKAHARATLGHVLYLSDRFDEAESELRAVVAAFPKDQESRTLLASLLRRIGRLDEALDLFTRLVVEFPAARWNFSMCLKDMGRLDEAIAEIEAAFVADRGNPDFLHCRSQLYLQAGRLEEGWRDFEARFDTTAEPVKRLSFPFPPLSADDVLADQNVLVWPEQGVGDQITFASALPDLISRCNSVEILSPPKLAALFRRSFPSARVLTDPAQSKASRHMPIGNLFPLYRRHIDDFPGAPYLVPDPAAVDDFKSRLDALGPGLKIGIGWRSTSVNKERQKHFFSSLLPWEPILSIQNVVFIDMQPKSETSELEEARRAFGCRIEHFDDLDLFNDLDSVAALSVALDLVISNGSANAFLSAASGAPTWMFYLSDAHWDRLGTFAIPWLGNLVAIERLWSEGWAGTIERMAIALRESQRQGRLIAPVARSPLRTAS